MADYNFDEVSHGITFDERLDAIQSTHPEDGDVRFLVAAVRHFRKQRDDLGGHLQVLLAKNPYLNQEEIEREANDALTAVFPNRITDEELDAIKAEMEREHQEALKGYILPNPTPDDAVQAARFSAKRFGPEGDTLTVQATVSGFGSVVDAMPEPAPDVVVKAEVKS